MYGNKCISGSFYKWLSYSLQMTSENVLLCSNNPALIKEDWKPSVLPHKFRMERSFLVRTEYYIFVVTSVSALLCQLQINK
jgi:hypothetical protein